MPVIVLLGLLIAAALLPPLTLSAVLLERNNRAQQEVVTNLAESTAGAAIQTVDRQLQGMITTLRGLATANALEEGEMQAFYEASSAALAGTGSFVIVVDRDMNQLINTRRPFGDTLGKVADPEPMQLALESNAIVISDGFFGRVAQKWVFNTIMPWRQRGSDPLLLVMTQNAESLAQSLTMENLRGGWNAAIVDRKAVVLASTFMSSDVGKPFFLSEVEGALEPGRSESALDGRSYDTVTALSQFSGWRVILWADHSVAQAVTNRTLFGLVLGGVAMIAAGALAIWILSRQIARSIRHISEDARKLGAGEEVVATAYPVRELAAVSAAMADASAARRRAENEIRLLMREVAHRSKNQLTVVTSLAKQSARGAKSVTDLSESFQQRILGLARSTDLLIAGGVAGVELSELLRVQIEPFRPGEATKLQMTGPKFRLSLQAAQTLGLAIHEMATNAAKYGALSTAQGRLTIVWEVSGDELTLTWREAGGGSVTEDGLGAGGKTGFGTQLIDRTLSGALGARIERDFAEDGLTCRFVFPIAQLAPDATGQSKAGDELSD